MNLTQASVALLGTLVLTAAPALAQGKGSPEGAGIEPLTTVRVASGLNMPTGVAAAPGDYTRLFVMEKRGIIRIINVKTSSLTPFTFLNIDALVGGTNSAFDERGLLGLVFHPDYQSNGYFYVNYTNNAGNTVIQRYTVSADPNAADPTSGVTIMTFGQPFSNHNGGWMEFGPFDGYLYISTGDGGSANDPFNASQDITNQRLGKLLRIDVDGAFPYAIPPDNPFVGVTGDDEIWSYGLRNPWRCDFDKVTGDLYIGDVGQNAWEEITFEPGGNPGGLNHGWRCMEGDHCTGLSGCTCNSPTLTDPIHEYAHSFGCSITGGEIYRGCAIPTFVGTYIFGDWCNSRIWSFTYSGGVITNFQERTAELDPPGPLTLTALASFGEDARGEIYMVEHTSAGEVYKIVPVTPTIPDSDLDCNGVVDVLDLLAVLAVWGPCDGCLEDINGDGMVDVIDLLKVLAEWG